MAVIVVAGGARGEITELVHRSKKKYPDMTFIIFDTDPAFKSADIWEYRFYENEADMVSAAVRYAATEESSILVKGGVQTHTLLKEVLKKEHRLKTRDVLSHVALIDLPQLNRPLLLTDSAMNITPTEAQLEAIVLNAVEAAIKIGIVKPKVALISSAENHNPKMPSSVSAQHLTKKFQHHEDCVVFGPLSLDLALSKDAVKHKKFSGPIEGDADILVAPNIDVGNVLYKSLLLFGQATLGGTIAGTRIPIVLTSRSDSAENKKHALNFALKQIGFQRGGYE